MLSRERRLLLIVAAHGGRILASVFILDARGATRPVARDDGGRARVGSSICSAVYLPAGFSKWPPNWKRIAESSLFW